MATTSPSARDQPVNTEVRALLEQMTLGDLLREREGWSLGVQQPLVLDADASVGEAMAMLSRHKISSLPVLAANGAGAATAPFLGFFDVPTLLNAFFAGKFLHLISSHARDSPPNTADSPPPSHTQTAESLACMPARLKEDQPLQARPQKIPMPLSPRQQPMLGLMHQLNCLGPQFANMTLRHVTPGGDGEMLFGASMSQSLMQVIKEGFLRPTSPAHAAVHRVAVFDFGSEGEADTPMDATTQPIRILAVLSQSDIIRWLGKQLVGGRLGTLPEATLADLRLVPKPVVCVSADDQTIEAIDKVLRAGLPAAGVHNGAGHNALVGSLELADLKGIMADKLGMLALPVGEFLAVKYDTVWSSCHGAGAVDKSGLVRRETLLQQRTLVRCAQHDTFGQLLKAFVEHHARCVFVMDEHSVPLSVVTPTDVLRLITADAGEGVPTKASVSLAPPDVKKPE